MFDEPEWRRRFSGAKKAARHALARRDTARVLAIVLSRIYTLRNQLMHGGATWSGSVNLEQIRDCTAFMGKLVPVVIETMMDHPQNCDGVRKSAADQSHYDKFLSPMARGAPPRMSEFAKAAKSASSPRGLDGY